MLNKLFPGQLHFALTFWTCFSIFPYFVLLYLHDPQKKKKVTLTKHSFYGKNSSYSSWKTFQIKGNMNMTILKLIQVTVHQNLHFCDETEEGKVKVLFQKKAIKICTKIHWPQYDTSDIFCFT